MIIFKKAIPRRTVLRGIGASIALPMLDAMIPALASAAETKMPVRVGYTYTPNGIIRERFRPLAAGADYEMTDILRNWEPFRDKLLVLSNLDNGDLETLSGHVGGSSMFLTGMRPNESLSEIRCGRSVDQILADKLGQDTPLSSLQLCIENAAELAGQSAGGYSSAYTNTISWASPTTPLPMEHRPREIFERLFGDGGTDPQARQQRIDRQYSILDFIRDESLRVNKRIGTDDSNKLSEYLDAVRTVEVQVQKAEVKTAMELPDMQRPVGIPAHEDHLRLMFDMLVLAFQTDMTRVFTFMLAREYSEMVYTMLGHQDPYHPLTHHRGDPVRKRQAGEIDVYHARIYGEFLAKLAATRDADGSTLLDNSIMVYGAGMGDGDIHNQWNIPVALIGGGGGLVKGGRHIEYKLGTPLSNLHVTMLNTLGIPTETFGGELGLSSGALDLTLKA
jgi:Protein of unknown function (DUF1552)